MAALATTIGVLAVTAGPASAAVHTGVVIGGAMTIDLPSPYTYITSDLDDPDRPCIATPSRGNPPTLSLDSTTLPSSGGTTATAMNLATQYVDIGFFGSHHWYELELRLLAPAPTGMYNSGGIISTVMAQNLALQVVWYSYGSGVDLEPDEPCPAKTAACVGLSQLSLAGSWSPTGRVADLDDTAQLNVIPPYCPDPAIEELFDGSTITIVDMVIDF